MKTSERAKNIKSSATIKVADEIRILQRKGKKILRLDAGQPYFNTPKKIKDASIAALRNNKTFYSDSRGVFELREVICENYNKTFRCNLHPDKNVVVTPGVKQAILYAVLTLLDKGDEAIVLSPGWMSYKEIIKIAGGTPVVLECVKEADFLPDFESLLNKVTKNTRVIILNNPSNPTGIVLKKEFLKKVNQLCVDKEIYLICDEIYDKIIFDKNKFISILNINSELKNVILLNGFSKTYSMTGWRIGYVLGDENIIKYVTKFQQNSITCPSTFSQYGAIKAIKSSEDFVKNALKKYQENKEYLVKELRKLKKISFIEPEGGIYLMIGVSKINKNSTDLCMYMINKYNMSAIPGIVFGESSKSYIRICLANKKKDLKEFVRRLTKLIDDY